MGQVVTDASVSIMAMLGNPSLCLHVTCYMLRFFSVFIICSVLLIFLS